MPRKPIRSPRKFKDWPPEVSVPTRKVACRCVICCGYDVAALRLNNEANELHREHDISGRLNKDWKHHHGNLNLIIQDVRQIIAGKKTLHDVLSGEKQDLHLLNLLEQCIDAIENTVLVPLRTKGGKQMSEKQRCSFYRGLSKKAVTIHRKLAKHREAALGRLGRVVAALTINKPAVRTEEQGPVRMSVVSLDLYDYTLKARGVEAALGPKAVFDYNRKLQELFRDALRKVGATPETTPISPTGDGALIFLLKPAQAIKFARAVLSEATLRAQVSDLEEWRQLLRIGIATGEVYLQRSIDPDGRLIGFEAGGNAIIDAVRLQAACAKHSILIDDLTWGDLRDQTLRTFFTKPTTVKGKRGHTLQARRYIQPRT